MAELRCSAAAPQVWTVATAGCGLAPGFGVLLVRWLGGSVDEL